MYGDRWWGRWRRAFEYAGPNPDDTVLEHEWMDRLDLSQNGRQVGWLSCNNVRLATVVSVMRKRAQVWVMRSVVIPKNQIRVSILVVVAVHPANDCSPNLTSSRKYKRESSAK